MTDRKIITRFGKSVVIKRCRDAALFYIEVEGGGTQPPELAGRWRFTQAETAIAGYLAKGKAKTTESEEKPRLDQTIDMQRLAWEKEEADSSPPLKVDRASPPGRRHDVKFHAEV